MPRIAVGVDAGGTKTAVVYSVDGKRVRVDTHGAVSASLKGTEAAANAIATAIASTTDGAIPHAIFVGAAGAGRADVADGIRSALESRFANAKVGVRDDAYIALRAAIPEGDGVVLIAGTGSIAYAQRGNEGYRCGGYGYLVGDDGSGFAIGAAAIKHLLKSYDGRVSRDAFAEDLESHLDVRSLTDVLERVYRSAAPVGTIAGVAPLVLQMAQRSERIATRIVQSAALELFDLLKGAIKRAGLSGTSAPIALAGGLLSSNSLLTYLLETRILNEFTTMPIRKDNPEPCSGALAEAERLLS
jgi:N-acetylglucosamine kinase-like BadF-type ATPase